MYLDRPWRTENQRSGTMGNIIGKEGEWRNDEDDKTEIKPKFPKLIEEDAGYGNEDVVVVIEEHSPERGSKRKGREPSSEEIKDGVDYSHRSSLAWIRKTVEK